MKNFLRNKRARRVVAILIPIFLILQTGIYFAMQIRPPRFGDGFLLDNEGNPIVISGENRKDGFFTILIAGKKGRNLTGGELTNVIALLAVDTSNREIHMLSIPRDTMVARRASKINASYAIGGMPNLQRDISEMIGFTPDRYIHVDLDGFEEIVDILGGVEINIPQRMFYHDPYQDLLIDFQPGLQRLNGYQAGNFVRFRSGFADQDLGRVRMQQMFLQELLRQSITPANLFRIRPLTNAVFRNMETDMTIGELLWLANQSRRIGGDNFTTQTLPVTTGMYGGASYVFVNRSETLELINEKFNPFTRPITNITINSRRPGNQPATPQHSPTPSPATTPSPTPANQPTPPPTQPPPPPPVEQPPELPPAYSE